MAQAAGLSPAHCRRWTIFARKAEEVALETSGHVAGAPHQVTLSRIRHPASRTALVHRALHLVQPLGSVAVTDITVKKMSWHHGKWIPQKKGSESCCGRCAMST